MNTIAGRNYSYWMQAIAAAAIIVGTGWTLIAQGPPRSPSPVARAVVPPMGTAVVAGTVISAGSGQPVKRATIVLSSTAGSVRPLLTITDDFGKFRFDQVSAGLFELKASKAGFFEAIYREAPGVARSRTALSIAAGQRHDRLSIAMTPGSALAGRVIDDFGEPAAGAAVAALTYIWRDGERALQSSGVSIADDRGAFRISPLPAGNYILMITPQADLKMFAVGARTSAVEIGNRPAAPGYAPTYYPDATHPRHATPITLRVGEQHTGMIVRAPLTGFAQVQGFVAMDGTHPVNGAIVRVVNLDDSGFSRRPLRTTVVGPTGEFAFTQLEPGRYRVEAYVDSAAPNRTTPSPDADPRQAFLPRWLWGTVDVTVRGGDDRTVPVFMKPGLTVSGHWTLDGATPSMHTEIQGGIVLTPTSQQDGSRPPAFGQLNLDGTFTIAGAVPGTHRVRVIGPDFVEDPIPETSSSRGGWRATSLIVAGKDAMDFQLDVRADRVISDAVLTVTTARAARLSGTLLPDGPYRHGYTVLLFPADPTYWTPQSRRILVARRGRAQPQGPTGSTTTEIFPASTGEFNFDGVPAGSYRLVAFDDVDPGQWFDPAVLRRLVPRAIPVTLADGDNKTQDIRIAP